MEMPKELYGRTGVILFPCQGHAHETEKALLDDELHAYYRHITDDYDYRINIEPMPTPRPRSTVMKSKATGKQFVNVYHPKEYTDYKKAIAWMLKDAKLALKPGNYSHLFLTIYLPYPKSTPKKDLIAGSKHRKKPDWDNFIKGFQDAMEDGGIIFNDGAISDGAVRKRYTLEPQGFIQFNLHTL